MTHYINNLLFRNLFTFKGKASRKEYVSRIIFIMLLFFINALIDEYINKNKSWFFLVLGCCCLFLIYISIFQYFPLAVRRLHDLNASGWFVLISFIPFGQLLILWLMFKKGTDGVNDYGEPPEY